MLEDKRQVGTAVEVTEEMIQAGRAVLARFWTSLMAYNEEDEARAIAEIFCRMQEAKQISRPLE